MASLLLGLPLFFVFSPLTPTLGLAKPLFPFDQAVSDKSLVLFREELAKAVQERNFSSLRGFLSTDIQLSFGGDYGIENASVFFRDMPQLWDELARVLANGGGFKTDRETGAETFIAPYTFFVEAPEGLDVFEFVILTGPTVPIHAQPSADSPVIARKAYEVMPTGDRNPDAGRWQHIRMEDGRSGYVERGNITSGTDYRAGFERVDGSWKMIFFLAGD